MNTKLLLQCNPLRPGNLETSTLAKWTFREKNTNYIFSEVITFTFCVQMDFPIHVETISTGRLIVY